VYASGKKISLPRFGKGVFGASSHLVVFGKDKKGLGWPGRGGGGAVAENSGEESLAGSVYVCRCIQYKDMHH